MPIERTGYAHVCLDGSSEAMNDYHWRADGGWVLFREWSSWPLRYVPASYCYRCGERLENVFKEAGGAPEEAL